jgi:hypothetical protein
MRWAGTVARIAMTAAVGTLIACGPVHSVKVGRRDPGPEPRPVAHEGSRHGPPPWAPAHGYRHKHQHAYQSRSQTVDLVFDSGLGVYVVVGLPYYYYWDGFYLRLDAGQWVHARHLDARWSPCPADRVPGALRARLDERGKSKAKGKGRGRGAAKHRED